MHVEVREERWKRREAEARRALLGRWLDALPAAGWSGTSAALEEELGLLLTDEEARWLTSIQPGRLLPDLADLIGEKGWRVTFRRTPRARLITVRPAETC